MISFQKVTVICIISIVAWSALLAVTIASKFPVKYNLLAEFVTVDYLWDSTHVRTVYEESGQFVVANNVITGVKVSKDNDIFVTVPRWMTGVPSSLNKLVPNPLGPGYVLNPWPSWQFNAYNTSGALQFAQSMLIDSNNLMWIPDVGRTNFFDPNPAAKQTFGQPMLYVVNISTGQLVLNYTFPSSVLSPYNTFLNDLVLDETNGFVYITNTYDNGGIVVYNINTKKSKMFTSQCTQRNSSYDVIVNGINYGTSEITSPSDGIALSPDSSTLYFSPVQGTGLYMIATSVLQDFSNTNTIFQNSAVFLGLRYGFNDGMQFMGSMLLFGDIVNSKIGLIQNVAKFNSANSLMLSDIEESAASVEDLNWLDTFAIDFNNPNKFYFTTNKLNLFFNQSMDFTGQSGSNFKIWIADISTVNDDDDSSNDSNKVTVTLIILLVILGLFLIGICFHKFYCSSTNVSQSSSAIDTKMSYQEQEQDANMKSV